MAIMTAITGMRSSKYTKIAVVGVTMAVAGVTNSGALLDWETTDFAKFNAAGTAVAHNSFLTLDLLPYYILAGAVFFILGKALGIFKFGSGGK